MSGFESIKVSGVRKREAFARKVERIAMRFSAEYSGRPCNRFYIFNGGNEPATCGTSKALRAHIRELTPGTMLEISTNALGGASLHCENPPC